MDKCLELYPRIAREPPKASEETESSRFAELGVTTEEFELMQGVKYAACYRIIRGLIPPNIAKTDLTTMIADGVPKVPHPHPPTHKDTYNIPSPPPHVLTHIISSPLTPTAYNKRALYVNTSLTYLYYKQ